MFESLFETKEIMYQGALTKIHTRVDAADEAKNAIIYSLLKKIGYYDLNMYNFLKHLSDKRGAHIDVGHSPVIELVNAPITGGITPVLCIAVQTIWAVKQQVPELGNYWAGMEILEE